MYPGLGTVQNTGSQAGPARTALFFAAGFIIVFGLFAVARAGRLERITAPTSYLAFTAPDHSYICSAPIGWDKEAEGVPGGQKSRTVFSKGQAAITLKTDQSASAMADVINATNAQQQQFMDDMRSQSGSLPQGMSMPAPVPAVEQLHKLGRDALAAKYVNYAEQPMHAFAGQTGDARLSEWTAVGDGATPMHGYRVTMLTRDVRITLICRCPEDSWKILQPSFVKIIHSVGQGPG